MPSADDRSLHALALEKLTRVFGPRRGAELLGEVLAELGLDAVRSADDLARVGEALQRRTGFEATTGALLSVQATLRRI